MSKGVYLNRRLFLFAAGHYQYLTSKYINKAFHISIVEFDRNSPQSCYICIEYVSCKTNISPNHF